MDPRVRSVGSFIIASQRVGRKGPEKGLSLPKSLRRFQHLLWQLLRVYIRIERKRSLHVSFEEGISVAFIVIDAQNGKRQLTSVLRYAGFLGRTIFETAYDRVALRACSPWHKHVSCRCRLR